MLASRPFNDTTAPYLELLEDDDVPAELAARDVAPERESFRRSLRQFWERRLPGRGWKRVVVLGAGASSDALLLALRGYDVTLVDVEGSGLGLTRRRFDSRGLPVTVVRLDPERPALLGPYDAVFVSATAPPVPGIPRALRARGLMFVEPGARQPEDLGGLSRGKPLGEGGVAPFVRGLRHRRPVRA